MCGGGIPWVTRLRVVNDGIMKSSMNDSSTVQQNKTEKEKKDSHRTHAHTQ